VKSNIGILTELMDFSEDMCQDFDGGGLAQTWA